MEWDDYEDEDLEDEEEDLEGDDDFQREKMIKCLKRLKGKIKMPKKKKGKKK